MGIGISCGISVTVTASTVGTLTNTTSTLTSNEGPPGGPAVAVLTVTALPSTITPTASPTASPTPTVTPIFVQGYFATPVIPVFQNPAAGGLFNPIAKSPTPRPQVVAVAPAGDTGCNPPPGQGVAGICLRPPNTGDAGLKPLEDSKRTE
jgi:hypothetical protein